jgi:16S rRNA (cytosine1402-N4)-methyltransferase
MVPDIPQEPTYSHEPVLADEVVSLLAAAPPGVVVDATLGGGGHASALLEGDPARRLLGLDVDQAALEAAGARLERFGSRAVLRRANFADLAEVARAVGVERVAGVLLDLGVSSFQLDTASRGFSFHRDGPLDMRMGASAALDADALVNELSLDELERVLIEGGEDRYPRRIARAIVASRPLHSTAALARVVAGAVPAQARRGAHPARRTFQALRIAVNGELDTLRAVLPQAVGLLAPGGRLVVLSYHSGEDRIVKQFLRDEATGGCRCPKQLPCVCGATPRLALLTTKALRPEPGEQARNRRATPARLRAGERLPLPGAP